MTRLFLPHLSPWVLFIFLTLAPYWGWADPKPINQLPHIASLPVIRIIVTVAYGNGHQSLAANAVTRLRFYGYEGEIEVIYDFGVAEKLQYLMPPFVYDLSSFQRFADLKLSFFLREYFNRVVTNERYEKPYNQTTFPPVLVGIAAADDREAKPQQLNAYSLVTVQPMAWDLSPAQILYSPSTLDDLYKQLPLRNELVAQARELNRSDLNNLIGVEKPTDVASFVRAQLAHAEPLRQKTTAVEGLLAARATLDFAPIYGHAVSSNYQLMNYLHGLNTALQVRPELFGRGIVVPVLNEVSALLIKGYERKISSVHRVKILDYHDPDFAKKVSETRPGEITVVFLGALTKSLFEIFYASATLPPLVEGLNSEDLMGQLGFPYLMSTNRRLYHFKYVAQGLGFLDVLVPQDRDIVEIIDKAHMAMIADLDNRTHDKIAQDLAIFFISVKSSNSRVVDFFARHRIDAQNLAYDKLFASLKRVDRLIEEKLLGYHQNYQNEKASRDAVMQSLNDDPCVDAFAK